MRQKDAESVPKSMLEIDVSYLFSLVLPPPAPGLRSQLKMEGEI